MNTRLRIIALVLALLLSVSPLVTAETVIPDNVDQTKLVTLLLEVALTAGGVEYEIDGNETGFVVHIVDEALSEALFMNMIMGNDESDEAAAGMVQLTVDWLTSIYTDMLELGIDDLNVLFLQVYSFDEPDYVYLAVCNGELIYDWSASH